MQVIGTVSRVSKNSRIFSCKLVRSENCLLVPVRPVEVVIHQSESKYMRNIGSFQDNSLVFAIKVAVGNVIQMSISPPDLVSEVVHSDSIRPGKLVTIDSGHNHSVVTAIHTNPANVGLQVPRGVEDVTNARVNGQCSRIINVSFQCFPVGTIQLCYTEMLCVSVKPVKFPSNPIDRQALQTIAVVLDDVSSVL